MSLDFLAVADSDSYVRWAAATLDRLHGVDSRLAVVDSPVRPSASQLASALAGTRFTAEHVPTLSFRALTRSLREDPPRALLLATTGPVADAFLRALSNKIPRPVVVSGQPGVALPATQRAVRYRATVDVLVVHSLREAHEYSTLARTIGTTARIVVNRLPFLCDPLFPLGTEQPRLQRVVFAAQAKFPSSSDDRVRIVRSLGRLAAARPDLDVVMKLRAQAGEAQTHRERFPYDSLLAAHAHATGVRLIRTETGSMGNLLTPEAGVVSVSSTAIVEAASQGLRALVLGDFGVGPANLTDTYIGSGLIGSLADLERGELRSPAPEWLRDNYGHSTPDELMDAVRDVDVSRPLPAPARIGRWHGRLRRRVRLAAPWGARRRY